MLRRALVILAALAAIAHFAVAQDSTPNAAADLSQQLLPDGIQVYPLDGRLVEVLIHFVNTPQHPFITSTTAIKYFYDGFNLRDEDHTVAIMVKRRLQYNEDPSTVKYVWYFRSDIVKPIVEAYQLYSQGLSVAESAAQTFAVAGVVHLEYHVQQLGPRSALAKSYVMGYSDGTPVQWAAISYEIGAVIAVCILVGFEVAGHAACSGVGHRVHIGGRPKDNTPNTPDNDPGVPQSSPSHPDHNFQQVQVHRREAYDERHDSVMSDPTYG
jgi:hypothetical protein